MFRRLGWVLASPLPNGRILDVPAASHAMHIENPRVVNDAVSRFLADVTEQDG